MKKIIFLFFTLLFFLSPLYSASKYELNVEIKETIKEFKKQVKGSNELLKKAKGVLVFPNVYKAGFGIGGEYGEGALLINKKIVDYYNIVSASIGFQLGVQKKSIVILFMNNKVLKDFRNSDGWKVGVDGSVAIVKWGVGEDVNTLDIKDPVIGFIFNNKGLMYNLTLEGSKISKIKK
ncbi:YSC84-related protein [Nitrosophilus kaiyonis]|uniref:lipid-binding SYLF domain-containing protein n=1 Tax=Nitrosophilus kaiyonis TaxID=2930200 RepID=UPI002492D48B|nr:YSC84-related protein [Nitrosophilus kaiyonis]